MSRQQLLQVSQMQLFDDKTNREQMIRQLLLSDEVPNVFKNYPELVGQFTFVDLCRLSNAKIIIPLLELGYPYLQGSINTKENFFKICFHYNLNLTLIFLKNPQIKTMMMPFLKDLELYYRQYNFREVKQEEKKLISGFPTESLRKLSLKTLSPSTSEEDQEQKTLLETFPTYKQCAEHALKIFYGEGIVDFTKHFLTYSSDEKTSSVLAAKVAVQMYKVRLKLIESGKKLPTDKFRFLECGAGTGVLCKKIITNIGQMAKLVQTWAELYDTLEYHILDMSMPLIKIQRETTKEFADKVYIQQGDVRNVKEKFKKNSLDLVLLLEVVDAVMPEVIANHPERGLVIRQMVPMIPVKVIKDSKLTPEFKKELERKSEEYTKLLKKYNPNLEKDFMITSREDFFTLLGTLFKEKPNQYEWAPLAVVDIKHNPKIAAYVKKNPEISQRRVRHEDESVFVHDDASDCQRNIYPCLIDLGELMVIDYCFDVNGYTSVEKDRFKVINLQNKIGMYVADIFFNIGVNDVSVDFEPTQFVETEVLETKISESTVLESKTPEAEASETRGMQVLFFGKQEQLSVNIIPESILSLEERQRFNEKSVASKFVVLVQQKPDPKTKVTPTEIDPERFEGKCLPVTKAQVKQQLDHLFKTIADFPHQALCLEAANLLKQPKYRKYQPYLTEIKQKHYAAALRKAAAVGSVDLVALVLKYKNWLAEDFNINEAPQNGKTALNWLKEAKASVAEKIKIKEMLLAAGAEDTPQVSLPCSSVHTLYG